MPDATELHDPYFDLQAEIGVTNHPGGLATTRQLISLCHLNAAARVLVVGCGIGATACYVARHYDCTVTGVDISQRMIDRSNERAASHGVRDKVKFQVADAQALPFRDDTFDTLISESVTGFVGDKARALREYVRVTKPGGYIGLVETTWLQPNPPDEIVAYASRAIGGVKPETADGWVRLLEDAGLSEVRQEMHRMRYLSQFINEIRMVGVLDSVRPWGRLISLYFTKPAYKKAIRQMQRDAAHMPRHTFSYMGYGVYTARKASLHRTDG